MADFADTMGDAWLEDEGVQTDAPQAEVAETVEAPEVPTEAAPADPEAPANEAEEQAEKFNPTLYREMKDERRKRQEAEAKAQELERRYQEAQAKAPATPKPRLDAYEDPEGVNAFFESRIQQEAFQIRADLSRERALEKHGQETVDAATQWAIQRAATDPAFDSQIGKAQWPADFVVAEYKRSQTLEALGGRDLDDLVKERAEEYAKSQGWIVSPEGQPSSLKPSQPTPPRSLANVPSTGSKQTANAGWDDVSFALDKKAWPR
jgi:hypothetical protein